VGLISTIQHINKLGEVKKNLKDSGFNVIIGKGVGRLAYSGQVLGCNVSSAQSISDDVDCFLFIGSGNFHAIGAALVTQKPVIIADPYLNEIRETEKLVEDLLRKRHGAIARAQEAESFGIIVSTKPGQIRMNLAFELKELLKRHKKDATILLANRVDPDHLLGFDVQALVSTACPRIAMDDYLMFPVTVLTPLELKILLKEKKWEDYTMDLLL
jgi:2-(3-amino-3-carboxypropyl)histidine synthase